MKVSLVIGRWWLRFRYPDTGVWRYGTKTWVFRGKNQKRTEWFAWWTYGIRKKSLPS